MITSVPPITAPNIIIPPVEQDKPQHIVIHIPDEPPKKPELTKEEKKAEICRKIKFVALAILISVIGVILFVANPTFFAIGFIAGVIWNKKVQEAIDKVLLIWKKQTWGIVIVTGIGAFIALPVTLAASAVLFGGAIGSYLSRKAQEQDEKDKRVIKPPSALLSAPA